MKKLSGKKSDLEGGDYKCLGKSRSSMSCANTLEEKNARKKNTILLRAVIRTSYIHIFGLALCFACF